jgi:hypothetical protein
MLQPTDRSVNTGSLFVIKTHCVLLGREGGGGFSNGDYECYYLVTCDAMQSGKLSPKLPFAQ